MVEADGVRSGSISRNLIMCASDIRKENKDLKATLLALKSEMQAISAAALEENRQLRSEIEAARADNFAMRGEKLRHSHGISKNDRDGAYQLPFRFTVEEFAAIAALSEETIRRKIRCRKIVAFGPPYLIPRGELEKLGISLKDVAESHSCRFLNRGEDLEIADAI